MDSCQSCCTFYSSYLFFSPFPVPDPPLIDLSNSKVYNEASICWRLPEDHLPTDHHILEYRRWASKCRELTLESEHRRTQIQRWTEGYVKCNDFNLNHFRLGGPGQSPSLEDGEDSGFWRATDRVYGPSTVVCDLDPNSLYAFRVRSCRNSMFSPYSPEVTFHTPPATGESWRRCCCRQSGVLNFTSTKQSGGRGCLFVCWAPED